MADKLLKSIKFPTLPDRYVIGDATLTEEGAAAEAKAVGEALATKADTKGTYEDLIVGGAEQLMADGYETDTEPYLFRPTGGSADVGNREYLDKIVGGTVAWNQLVQNGDFADTSHWALANATDFSVTNNIGSFTATAQYGGITGSFAAISGHKFCAVAQVKISSGSAQVLFGGSSVAQKATTITGAFETISAVFDPTYTGTYSFPRVRDKRANGWDAIEVKNVMFIDLTAMFGSTIADYIYNLEQSQAGAGVAWFRNYFPKDYYPYDPGTLRSVEGVSAHETVGFNQWDEEWELGYIKPADGQNDDSYANIRSKNYIQVIPGITYFAKTRTSFTVDGIKMFYYDSDKNFISCDDTYQHDTTFVIPNNCRFVRFYRNAQGGTTYNNDICINISNPTRNGEYEPYTKHTYPLDSSLTLRGIPKLADGKLAFDGDVYPPSGEVQRRYGVVDLGTLNEWYLSSNGVFVGNLPQSKGRGLPCVCTKYFSVGSMGATLMPDKTIQTMQGSTSSIWVKDSSYSDVESFKSAISGVMLVYPLATPTTETAEGYEQYQICDPSGTEEFVTTGIVPVGHETRYPHDLKKKIETAPDSPSTDGTYLMKRSGGKNAYMALPSTPSANGAYVLTVTVSGGSASYSWAAKE